MAKALVGTVTAPSQLALLDEIRSLRQRVAELEAALAEASDAPAERVEVVEIEQAATVGA